MTSDDAWFAFSSVAVDDTRSPERHARWNSARDEIRQGRYERPSDFAIYMRRLHATATLNQLAVIWGREF